MRIAPSTSAAISAWFPGLDLGEVRIITSGPVCWFVRSVLRQGAMTFAPYVFFGRDPWDPSSARSVALLAHEIKHIEQYGRLGHAGFLARYFRDLAANRFRYSETLTLEAEAYALQAEVRAQIEGVL
jgi:hypothetical protein